MAYSSTGETDHRENGSGGGWGGEAVPVLDWRGSHYGYKSPASFSDFLIIL